ncbi:MAG: DMT family transporter [Hyphomicrobiaceae bacterium]
MTSGTPAGTRNRDELMAYVLLALAALCWSGNHVLGRAAAGHVPPFAISLFRWGVALILLWPFAGEYVRRDWPTIKAHWRTLVFLGVLGGAIFGVLQYIGARYTTAINISVLNALAPVMIALAGAGLFGDRLSRRQTGGIAVSLAGVALIVTKADFSRLAGLDFNWGDLIILFNVGVWAIYSVCLRWRPRMHWLSFTYCLAAISTLATAPFFAAEHLSGVQLQPTLLTALVLGYVAVFPSVVGFAAWSRGVEILGPARSGATMHLIPLFSALIANVTLGEVLHGFHVAGFAMILAGVWLSSAR